MVKASMTMRAVLTAAGLGTRLLPYSKEIPKEMAPIFSGSSLGDISVKPILQAIFEQLYDFGLKDYIIVVGRGKRSIEDHFTPDSSFISLLSGKGKTCKELAEFYRKVDSSNMSFVNQPEPKGFGDAVLRVKPYVRGVTLVHAGDTYIISRNCGHLKRLVDKFNEHEADAAILFQEVHDPKQYGVAITETSPDGALIVKKVVEKPEKPISNLAIMPIYIFTEKIFEMLEKVQPGKGGEIQLTDAIQMLLDNGYRVVGTQLKKDEIRLDIGTPTTLIEALQLSLEQLKQPNKR
ncbi:MAG: sugar phosphate nucleotidyltransferase [Promethearchaeati archaeon SRVP18_Atabeyarchaeia-1]